MRNRLLAVIILVAIGTPNIAASVCRGYTGWAALVMRDRAAAYTKVQAAADPGGGIYQGLPGGPTLTSGPWGPCITGAKGSEWTAQNCPD